MLKASMSRPLRGWTSEFKTYLLNRSLCTSAAAPLNAPNTKVENKPKSSTLVSSVFANLSNDFLSNIKEKANKKIPVHSFYGLRENIKNEIESSSDVNSLLSITNKNITYQESLKIISVLAEWSSSNKIKPSEFQLDQRFIDLCNKFGSQSKKYFGGETNIQFDDLNTVTGVVSDDEAARLVSNMTISQMIKVMIILAQKKRRSITLLRTLSFNISRHPDLMSLKKCADLLYPMVLLNFPDPVLMDRICSDIQENLPSYKDKSSVIGSIITSLGILKYKHEKLLDGVLEWMITNFDTCRPQDISSMVLTMAILNHNSATTNTNLHKIFNLNKLDFDKTTNWLDYVWSLIILGKGSEENVSSVLNKEFIESLKVKNEIPFGSYKKLLNVNGYAKVILNGYKGPFLPEDMLRNIQIPYSKEKIQFTNVLHTTLKNLLASDVNLKKNCDSNMGFLFDALCILDSKRNPYPVDANLNGRKTLKKVAMFALDYHDMCKNTLDPLGPICFYKCLLEAQNYKVIFVPYKEFNPKDKLVDRVQFIEKKLAEIVNENDSTNTR